MQKFTIPLSNVLKKKTTFNFNITKDYFETLDITHKDFLIDNIQLLIEAQMLQDHFKLEFSLTGKILLACDACLSHFPKQIWEEYVLLLKPTNTPNLSNETNSDTNITYIHRNSGSYDFSKYLYDCLCLAIPHNKKCDDVGKTKYCDQKNLSELNKYILN